MTSRSRQAGARPRIRAAIACALSAILSACAAQTGPKPLPRDHEAALVPPSMTITLSDGAPIPLRVWQARSPHAVVLAFHGFGDSRDAWEWPAPHMAAAGITTIAPDQRGFGAAPLRGDWSSAARMVRDASEEAAFIHARMPDMPLYVMGESMGGAIALMLDSQRSRPPIAGTILVSPAIWPFDWGSRAVVNTLASIAPHWAFTGEDLPVHVVPSDNLAAMRRLYFDPLTLHAARLDSLAGLVRLMNDASRTVPRAPAPMLILYGDHDQLVPAGPMARLWRETPHARHDLILGGHHLLLRDRPVATADVIAWITDPDVPLPSGGDIAAAAWMAGDP
ncbi:alpha/beta fold hydrolase [Tanticharoenia sakaeratensis]|uniref:alpha/beta fold hydrolase n=1 Tax=Tanticharoenia sakaeratensis TaxID=444053 RepID=UPI00130EE664|nr:alpha/beta fold hydrolase [Tanticharoenia sakaeratensis]